MSKNRVLSIAALSLALVASQGGRALAAPGAGAASHEGHGAAAAPGVQIRESKVQAATLVYRLYTWAERNVMMKGMEGHVMAGMDDSGASTNHLMLFVKGADGKELSGGKVGFVVVAPDKSEFKTLTMAMGGGYGADIPLKAKGAYTIRTKAVVGGQTLTEEFAYTVK